MANLEISQNDRRKSATASAGQTSFSFDFPIYTEEDLLVTITRADVVLAPLVLNVDYTVDPGSLENQAGGNITLTTGAVLDDLVVIEGDASVSRESNYATRGEYRADSINKDLNRQIIMIQEQLRDLQRTLLLSPGDIDVTPGSLLLPITEIRRNKLLGFDDNGLPVASDLGEPGSISLPLVISEGGTGANTGNQALDNLGLLAMPQAEAEAGTATDQRRVSAAVIASAIAAQAIPVGTIAEYGGAAAPAGWFLCNFQSLVVANEPALFAVIGYTYGGSGANFNVPDFRGRSPIGAGQGDTADGGGTGTLRSRGDKTGAETDTLTVAQIPPHTHPGQEMKTNQPNNSIAGGSVAVHNGAGGPYTMPATGSTGSGDAHNNMAPVLGVNFIIKA